MVRARKHAFEGTDGLLGIEQAQTRIKTKRRARSESTRGEESGSAMKRATVTTTSNIEQREAVKQGERQNEEAEKQRTGKRKKAYAACYPSGRRRRRITQQHQPSAVPLKITFGVNERCTRTSTATRTLTQIARTKYARKDNL